MGTLDQYMDAICANSSNEEGSKKTEKQSSVTEGHRHSKDTSTQTALQQMYEGVHVRRRVSQLPVLERVVKRSFLVVRSFHERQRRAVCDGNRYVIFLALVSAKPSSLISTIPMIMDLDYIKVLGVAGRVYDIVF